MSQPSTGHGAPAEPEILESPEAVLSTLHKDGRRRWMYPTLSEGALWRRRRLVGWALIVLFVALPIIQIKGKPAVLLDILHSEFTFFGLTLYATDTILLMLLMITILLSVVFATALMGRVWCGWGCPQTIYLEFVYRPIERLLEGRESRRQRQDEGDLSAPVFWRKLAKYLIFFVISIGLAHTFVAYFVGWSDLIAWMTGPPTQHWGFFLMMALTTSLVMLDFAWFREQMCTIVCPYARLQSVLMDRDSLIVSYDPGRGEPRGRRRKGAEEAGLGDCVDCLACVRTCPTGIDIRDGLQMECVGCTQCIDACDAIMAKVEKPAGLIRYTSENALERKTPRILRPRVMIYGALLAVMVAIFAGSLSGRQSVEVNVTRVPGAPFVLLPDGNVANRLRFRVHNRTGQRDIYRIEALAPEGARVKVIGSPEIALGAGEMKHVDTWIEAPAGAFSGGSTLGHFKIVGAAEVGESPELDFKLLGPFGSQGGR